MTKNTPWIVAIALAAVVLILCGCCIATGFTTTMFSLLSGFGTTGY